MKQARTRGKSSRRKISETFLEFATPLLASLGNEATLDEMETR